MGLRTGSLVGGLGQDLFEEDQKFVEAGRQGLLFKDIEQVTQGMDYTPGWLGPFGKKSE
ncbi:uncharacterized protein G2W53_006148 [Senna tora]|uniref:Uncharacterized protein n=1 Tax=Senna tora TaxID=362788 RepID=A0A834X3I5_9FABA|nr:uncharacterized protein G2W53_006148 [Senna tora]